MKDTDSEVSDVEIQYIFSSTELGVILQKQLHCDETTFPAGLSSC